MTLLPSFTSPQISDEYGSSIPRLGRELLEHGSRVEVPTWQAMDVTDKPQGVTIEISALTCYFGIPENKEKLQGMIGANQPWAEEHFQERVSGIPYNPPPSAVNWPFTQGSHKDHTSNGKFSHTYPERFCAAVMGDPKGARWGLRYRLGNLDDVVRLLAREPTTRQAYLPVFFPEDTGANMGQRIPCTLGYQFLMRDERLHIIYGIRSCDFLRHFRDDVYMAGRLCQWMIDKLQGKGGEGEPDYVLRPGNLTMHIGSLHVFEGDLPNMRRKYGIS